MSAQWQKPLRSRWGNRRLPNLTGTDSRQCPNPDPAGAAISFRPLKTPEKVKSHCGTGTGGRSAAKPGVPPLAQLLGQDRRSSARRLDPPARDAGLLADEHRDPVGSRLGRR